MSSLTATGNNRSLLSSFPEAVRADSIKPPTARDLWDLFKVTYSIPGGNRRCLENDTICHWFNWLAEVQDGECPPLTVAMVLEFATGATVVPPLGFEDTPTIEFLHTARGRLAGQQKKKYPEANTCAVTLRLPLHSTYNAFREFMTSGIVNSPHFGVA
ncbi:G2/M phase-specific E3 ubiquitin-protein ligase-like [Salmo trutta]|uniref:G2/M phase-specific E3 ubiquitin-protein ligase-like n=1 Tax=Salmo trutta TaxID=8032 RepID=UPI0011310D4D|nr:G2/M phase-specific E3 ubiquitin-protein ligase-like [Salmo trutta]